MKKVVETDIQIRFGDVDGLGHINNSHIQEYYDLAKMDFYAKAMGAEIVPENQSPVIVSNHTDYMAQSRLYDKLYVETCVEKIGNKSTTLRQRLIDRKGGEVKSICHTVLVQFDFAKQESIELSAEWKKALAEYMAG